MSSKETEKLVERYFAAFNAADLEGMVACLGPAFVHDVNQGERRKGKQKFREFSQHMTACYREELRDIVVMVSKDGTRAAAEFVVHGQYIGTDAGLPKAKGQKYKLPAGTFFAVKEGLIIRVSTYYNLTNWLAQVKGD